MRPEITVGESRGGLHYVYLRMPREEVGVRLSLRAGSRYERPGESGAAHFLEHMPFQGADTMKTSREVAIAAERKGLDTNAQTDHDDMDLLGWTSRDRTVVLCNHLSRLVANPLLLPEEVEKERKVILQEIEQRNDSPSNKAWDLAAISAFPDHPYASQIIGRDVASLTAEGLRNFHNRWWNKPQALLGIVGDIDARQLQWCLSEFDRLPSNTLLHPLTTATIKCDKPDTPRYFVVNGVRRPDQAQTHLTYIWHVLNVRNGMQYTRSALSIAGTILGGSMGSRLHQVVRCDLGLAYEINAWGYMLGPDTPVIVVQAVVDGKRAEEANASILGVMDSFSQGIPENEFRIAHELSSVRLLRSTDSPSNQLGTAMSELMYYGGPLLIDDWLQIRSRVAKDSVESIFESLSEVSVGVCGPDISWMDNSSD